MINKNKVRECYNAWSDVYDQNSIHNAAIIMDHPIIIKIIEPEISVNSIGLDLGCGTGILTTLLANKVCEMRGLDISERMIERAKGHNKDNVQYLVGDISQKLPFDDNFFDFALSSLTLSHIEDLENVYCELRRVLKNNGLFIFDEITSKLNKSFAPKYHDYLKDYSQQDTIWTRRQIDDHIKLAERYGFNNETIINTKIDNKLSKVLSKEDYLANKGCQFTSIIKLRLHK
mgnify:FL=1